MRLHGVGGTIRGTWVVRYFLVSSFIFLYLESHIRHVRALTNVRVLTNVQVLANVRVQTVVLPAWLAGVVGLCLVCLVCGLYCCRLLVALGPSFSLCFRSCCVPGTFFFSFSSCSCLRRRRKGPCSFPLKCVVDLLFVVPFVLCVLLVKYL